MRNRKLHLSGFSLFELVIVVLMIGILAAIAAPSWLAFTNMQRVNKANDAVLVALQSGQREAKRTKLSHNVSFLSNPGQAPQVAIYRADSSPIWTKLGEDLALKPGQVFVYANISATPNKIDATGISLATTAKTITFDYLGALPLGADTPLKVIVAEARPGTSLDPHIPKRCVVVETLIGGMETAQDDNCN